MTYLPLLSLAGGPADRAGLRKNDIVIRVNGSCVTDFTHAQVVSLIHHSPNSGVWLSVCDPPQEKGSFSYSGGYRGYTPGGSNLTNFSMSQSSPLLHRGMFNSPRDHYRPGDNPPRYDQVAQMDSGVVGRGGYQLGHPAVTSSIHGISPLKQRLLTESVHNGRSMQNGQGIQESRMTPPISRKKTATEVQSSVSVLVLYIGPVEIPESWSSRGLSSKCIQECTRRLLSQRQDFIEVYLEFSLATMKILNVSRSPLVKHRRDELYYTGICTEDEQYFAIVTQKGDSRSGRLVIDPEVGQTVPSDLSKVRANICHVFKVIQGKSVMVVNIGEGKKLGSIDQALTHSVSSSLTVINTVNALFGGGDLQQSLTVGSSTPSSLATSSAITGSSESILISTKKSPQPRRKKLSVFDLRPSSISSSTGSVPNISGYSSSPNQYTVDRTPFRGGLNREVPNHPMATPAFLASSTTANKWYATGSPKEGHSRQGSWDAGSRPVSGGGGGGGRGEKDLRLKGSSQDMLARKVSDDSLSSLSSPRTPTPSKRMFHSSMASRSRSPSPARISYSSGSRSRSPSPSRLRSPMPPPPEPRPLPSRLVRTSSGRGSLKLSASLALEMPSMRSGAISPVSSMLSQHSGRMLTLRRQVCVTLHSVCDGSS